MVSYVGPQLPLIIINQFRTHTSSALIIRPHHGGIHMKQVLASAKPANGWLPNRNLTEFEARIILPVNARIMYSSRIVKS